VANSGSPESFRAGRRRSLRLDKFPIQLRRNGPPVKRWFAVAFLAGAIAISEKAASAADNWKIIKVRGSDYLGVDNISQFYGLPAGIAASSEKWNSRR